MTYYLPVSLKTNMTSLAAVILTGALSIAFSQSVPPSVQAANAASGTGLSKANSFIKPGDVLDVTVFTSPAAVPEFSEKILVAEEGRVSLPLLGPVSIGNVTVEAAQGEITRQYLDRGIYKNVQVNLLIAEYGLNHSVSVAGEVQRPGVFPVSNSMRLVDAIALAGGTTARAGRHVYITRMSNASAVEDIELADGNAPPARDVVLNAGDKVVLERTGTVYVTGDVNKPGGFVMDATGKLTVLQAIALAEGATPTAKLEAAKLIRNGPRGREELPLPLKSILENRGTDVMLRPDDIVFVPNSTAKTTTRRTLEAIVQAATGLVIYSHHP